MRAREALRPGVDWSQVAARECFDCGTDDLPGVFAELGRRARGEVRYEESDFWAPVREDVAWPGLSEVKAGCGCGGSCGSAACGGGEVEEVDDFWAPVVEGRRRTTATPCGRGGERRSRKLLDRLKTVPRGALLRGGGASAPSHEKTSPVPEDGSVDTTVDAEPDTATSWCYDTDGHRVDCCSWFCTSGPCLEVGSEEWSESCWPRSADVGELLEAPAEKARGKDCRDKLKGDDTTCATYLRPQTLGDFWAIDPDNFADTVIIEDAMEDEQELIEYAWAFLHENIDLIEYAFCWVTGRPGGSAFSGAPLLSALHGAPLRVTIRIGSCTSDATTISGRIWDFGAIYICGAEQFWTRAISIYRAGRRKQVPCAVAEVAMLLLHELTHVVWRALGDAWTWLGDCRTSYLVENIFRWAVYQRYSWLGNDADGIECCSGNGEDEGFGSASTYGLKGGCS